MFVAIESTEYINTAHITSVEFYMVDAYLKIFMMNGTIKHIYDVTVIRTICDNISVEVPYYLQ